MIDPTKLAADLQALAGKATEGPWQQVGYCGFRALGAGNKPRNNLVGQMNEDVMMSLSDENAALIVALRNNLPTITAALLAYGRAHTDGSRSGGQAPAEETAL